MSKKSKKINQELMPILLSPDVNITFTDLSNYSGKTTVAYFVFQAANRKFEMNIEQKKFGISTYTIVMDNGDKFSCKARPDAVFFQRPVAIDILEIYRAIKLRHLMQQFNHNSKTHEQ